MRKPFFISSLKSPILPKQCMNNLRKPTTSYRLRNDSLYVILFWHIHSIPEAREGRGYASTTKVVLPALRQCLHHPNCEINVLATTS
jgi:hypothetical protein